MMIRPLSILIGVLGALAGSISAEPPVRDHDISLDDYFTQSFIGTCAMSPDGLLIAYTEMRWEPEEDRRNTDLWVASIGGGGVTRLTFEPEADGNPQWSPDGRWIYFTSARSRGEGEAEPPFNGKRQIWRVRPEGGEIFAVTRLAGGVDGYELSHDGRTLYYIVGADQVDDDRWKALREQFDELTYGHGVVEHSQLWKLDLESWRREKLVDDRRVIREFSVSHDERRIAMLTAPTEELITNEGWSQVDVHDTATGTTTALPDSLWRAEAPSPYGWLMQPVWSDDGTALAFAVGFDGYPAEVLVARFGSDGGPRIARMERPGEVSVEGQIGWRPQSGDLCFIGDDHARSRVYCLRDAALGDPTGSAVLTPGDVVVDAMSFARDGRSMAVAKADPTSGSDLFVLPATGGDVTYQRVTTINPQVESWKLPQIQIVRWRSDDGTEVEGILELPPDHQPSDGPLPTVVVLHGGPTSSSKYCFRFWIYGRTLYPARGWAMFSPNYRGSTGYGDEFLIELIGHENERDVQDIMSGIDALVERGIADPERLAVMGWSNGGYLTNCLITHTDRFKAASSGAGVFDQVMQWSIEDTPGHVINYAEGLPWTNPRELHEMSPMYGVDRVTTPTLIHVGEKDERVPAAHSIALHRALYHYLDVPCQLVIYPGTGHGLRKHSHRKAKLEWDLQWFDYHVLGQEGESSTDE